MAQKHPVVQDESNTTIETHNASTESTQKTKEKILKYFSLKKEDSLKLRAAIYLIDNMFWHSEKTSASLIKNNLRNIVKMVDSAYYALVKDKTSKELEDEEVKTKVSELSRHIHAYGERIERRASGDRSD